VNGGIKLSRFEPKPQSLHEAFVAMVGEDLMKTMTVDAQNMGEAS